MKKIGLYLTVLFTCLVSCTPTDLGEDDGEKEVSKGKKVTVCGYIYDSQTGYGIPYAKVDLKNVITEYADEDGFYALFDIEEGTYQVVISSSLYNKEIVSLRVSTDEDYLFKDFYLTPKSSDNNNENDNGNNNGNDDSNDGGEADNKEDYSKAEVSTDLSNLDVNLVSCYRKGDNVELTYTLTNTSSYGNMNITITNVNTFTQKTFISDDLGNQYSNKYVKISLGGKDWGYGNNIEGTLLTGIPSKCVITIKDVDKNAKYMTCYIYTSTALPGSVNYSSDVILKNVKIH